jgi:2-keto-4-pentenoate hydratase/2-oxohepta-3-ene-1,7-dioic acid hydratase in catechol pathway
MRIVRFWDATSNRPRYGVLEGDVVNEIEGEPYGELKRTNANHKLSGLRLLAPCQPTKIICGGLNYVGHAKETGQAIPKVPPVWPKALSALIGPDEPIQYPPETERLEFEAELTVVVGRTMRNVAPEDVASHILGYTCGNDVTARDMQIESPINLAISKSFDTFCPIGPWIETDLDPSALDIVLTVDGKVRQKTNTSDMIFPVPQMLSYFSHLMTLLPGDVILTGTPEGIGRMEIGQTCAITIQGIGTLSNPIVASPLRAAKA